MPHVSLSPKKNPAVWIGALLTIAAAIVAHLAPLSDSQWQAVLAAAPLLGGIVTRFHVSPSSGRRNVVDVAVEAIGEAARDAQVAAGRLADLRAAIAGALPPSSAAPSDVAASPAAPTPPAASPAPAADVPNVVAPAPPVIG